MEELTLNVNVEEANLILEGLGTLPFAKVYQLVANIQQQASEQVGNGAPASGEVDTSSLVSATAPVPESEDAADAH